jgi:hypothetical protein
MLRGLDLHQQTEVSQALIASIIRAMADRSKCLRKFGQFLRNCTAQTWQETAVFVLAAVKT